MSKLLSCKVTCLIFVLIVAALGSSAQTITTLSSFTGNNGSYPLGALVQGQDGNFYGAASGGGIYSPNSYGTIFKVASDGTITMLHSFAGTDGDQPQTALVHATDGNFYGTTSQGGSSNYGTIFRISASGAFTSLFSFTGGSDGRYPGQLIQASDGNFYGTAWGGANNNCDSNGGCGVIFKITAQGSFTKVYQFQGSSNDGYGPLGLTQGRDGNLYGMAIGWSQVLCTSRCGTVFRVTSTGHLTTLHTFNGQDGNYPSGQLLQASDGNFYGTTSEGGAYAEGTVFKMSATGVVTSLYSFCRELQNNCPDGATPISGLMQATDGTLYGTTSNGGSNGYDPFGTIFKITPSGNLTTLFSFNNGAAGSGPARLMQASNGDFYGVASGAGTYFDGTVFRFYTTGRTLYTSISGSGSVTSTDGAIDCPGTCTHIYANSTAVTLNASPAQGWGLSSWTGACTGAGSCNVVMTQDRAVSATFLPLYNLTVTTTGNGSVRSADGFIDCPGVCSHAYIANSYVTLTSYPALGWSLHAWNGACQGNNTTCTVGMYVNRSVSATFTQNTYTLAASISGQGTITSTDGFINCPGVCNHTYLSLTQVTLNATPASGWNFSGWSGACTGLGPCNVTMLGNLGASAYFMQPGSGLQFIPITPCRLVDTRTNNGGGPIDGESFRTFNLSQLAQANGCADLSSATAFSLNVTLVPVNQDPVYYLTIWPAGLAQPATSTMNSLDGRIKANAAVVPGGTNTGVNVYVTTTTNLVLDIDGYFTTPGASTLKFYPLPPCRIADTRYNTYPSELGQPHLSSAVARDFPVLSSPCVPSGVNPAAYSLNVTAIPYPSLGNTLAFLELWPTGNQPEHPVSTLNNLTGTYVANAAIVAAGTEGKITAVASNDTDLAIDINGYFGASGAGGLSLYPAPPCRVLDTRAVGGGQPFSGALDPPLDVVGSICAPPSDAQAYVFNATVVPSGPLSYLTLWPDGEGRPVVSTLNAADGWITSNMAIVPSGTNGKVDAFAAGLTQLVLDISSYFAP